MSAGRVEQIGTPRDVFERPASAFVADFMGFSNLVPIKVDGQGRGVLENGMPIAVNPQASVRGNGLLALRAEHNTLSDQPSNPEGNTTPATIESLVYRGSFVDYTVRIDEQTKLMVRGDATAPHKPGDSTFVMWQPQAGVLIPALGH